MTGGRPLQLIIILALEDAAAQDHVMYRKASAYETVTFIASSDAANLK